MPFNDVLLHLPTYPDAPPESLVDYAVTLCGALSPNVCAAAMPIRIPLQSNALADALARISDLAREEEQRSLAASRRLLKRFQEQAAAAGLSATTVAPQSTLYEVADDLARLARTRDLCVIQLASERDEAQRAVAETTVFQSGRPVVLFRAQPQSTPFKLDTVVIAWDGSRSAARAVADAMPLLTTARTVRILSVLGDKPSTARGGGGELARHLAAYDVAAEIDEVEAAGAHIGKVFRRHLATQPADLLVMGAFGHSRMREFVLGGATQSMLEDPPTPILLSH